MQIHSKLIESQLVLDTVLFNTLISLYSKNGDWVTAEEIFEDMGLENRDVVSWSAMISGFSNNGLRNRAIYMLMNMMECGISPNEFCFAAVIQACADMENAYIGKIIFGILIKSGYFGSVFVGCALIDFFVKGFRDLDSAREVFNKMPVRNSVTWTLMVTRYSQLGRPRDAIELFLDMLISGYVPDRFTYSSVVTACTKLGLLSLGQQLHTQVVKYRLGSDVCVGCSLIDMYVKCEDYGSMVNARRVFDSLPGHNVMDYTSIIAGYTQNGGQDKEAIDLYCKMIEDQVLPNHVTFSSLLKACENISDLVIGSQIFGHAVKLGLDSVDCVGNALISMFLQLGRMEDARKAFDILFQNNLIYGYDKYLHVKKSYDEFDRIENIEIGKVDAFTFASLLSGAASIGAIDKGEQIHARVVKSGFESNQFVSNALISMYSRCGNIEAGLQAFSELKNRNVISWTSIITGLAKHGFATKALEMFQKMIDEGVKPNGITYIAVLSACSHVGLINEGWFHFNSMYKEHGISLKMEHYACMVDILGRLGLLKEAIEFIESMPLKANVLVWRTLLSACRVHQNVEIGKYAAEKIIRQDPKDPAAYILLSNIYATMGQWDEVSKIRKSMKGRNLVKEAGCSWLEIENKLHTFFVGDTFHPRAVEIYKELEQLIVKIKEIGYEPDVDFVLHDVEEEQKGQLLLQHSEKIAVAFGLISSSSKSKPIRVFKNLRVCGDCHNAMKCIAMVTGREIVLRDSNRFHHFKDGFCSCNDYW